MIPLILLACSPEPEAPVDTADTDIGDWTDPFEAREVDDAGLTNVSPNLRDLLENGELDAEQARECVIQLTQYAGYPRAGALMGATEEAIAEYEAARD